jgi:hypothetical protein
LKEQFVAAEIVGDGDGDEDCSTSWALVIDTAMNNKQILWEKVSEIESILRHFSHPEGGVHNTATYVKVSFGKPITTLLLLLHRQNVLITAWRIVFSFGIMQ